MIYLWLPLNNSCGKISEKKRYSIIIKSIVMDRPKTTLDPVKNLIVIIFDLRQIYTNQSFKRKIFSALRNT